MFFLFGIVILALLISGGVLTVKGFSINDSFIPMEGQLLVGLCLFAIGLILFITALYFYWNKKNKKHKSLLDCDCDDLPDCDDLDCDGPDCDCD